MKNQVKLEKKIMQFASDLNGKGYDLRDVMFAMFHRAMMIFNLEEGHETAIVALNEDKRISIAHPMPGNIATIVSSDTDVPALISAVERSLTQFNFYVDQHAAKGTVDSLAKAEVNREFVRLCAAALGKRANLAPAKAVESALQAPGKPVSADLPFMAPIDAHAASVNLIREIHEAPDDEPVKSLAIQGEDRFIAIMLTGLGYLVVDDVSDVVRVTTEGRMLAGYRPDGHMDLPVEVAEITGNVEERELAARYIDGKIAGTDRHIAEAENPIYREAYEHVAIVLQAIAKEFRMGMHLPSVSFNGRVIPYSEDRSTGIMHSDGLARFFDDVYGRNVKAGWWTDIRSGEPKKRNVGELFMLMVTEIAEAYMAYQDNNAPDDKLPQFPGLGVEMGDLAIRVADFCGALAAGNIVAFTDTTNPGAKMFEEVCMIARHYESIRKTPAALGDPEAGDLLPAQDVAVAIDAKLAFNATRADHKIENRLKDGGKET